MTDKDIVEDWIAAVKSKARGRTRYEGQAPYADEAVVEEIERLRRENKRLSTFRKKHGDPPPSPEGEIQ